MPEFSAWLAGVKERLEKATRWEEHHTKEIWIRADPTDLALAVRIIEAVERLANDWERTFPRNEPSRELRAVLRIRGGSEVTNDEMWAVLNDEENAALHQRVTEMSGVEGAYIYRQVIAAAIELGYVIRTPSGLKFEAAGLKETDS